MIIKYLSDNLSDLSKMLAKKQMKYFDVPLDHGFDDYVITEMKYVT